MSGNKFVYCLSMAVVTCALLGTLGCGPEEQPGRAFLDIVWVNASQASFSPKITATRETSGEGCCWEHTVTMAPDTCWQSRGAVWGTPGDAVHVFVTPFPGAEPLEAAATLGPERMRCVVRAEKGKPLSLECAPGTEPVCASMAEDWPGQVTVDVLHVNEDSSERTASMTLAAVGPLGIRRQWHVTEALPPNSLEVHSPTLTLLDGEVFSVAADDLVDGRALSTVGFTATANAPRMRCLAVHVPPSQGGPPLLSMRCEGVLQ